MKKWEYIIDKHSPLSINGNHLIIGVKEKGMNNVTLSISFKIQKDCNELYRIIHENIIKEIF